MTTCVYDRRVGIAAADTQNTSPSGSILRVTKIVTLKNGSVFMGSGHNYTIAQCQLWAEWDFAEARRPDFSYYLEDPDDRGFECILLSADGKRIWRIDEELTPFEVMDDLVGVGSGGPFALGAMMAGATPTEAVAIAALFDPNTSSPISEHKFGDR